MKTRKTLEELVFHDDFMFTAYLNTKGEIVMKYQKNWWHCWIM